MQIGMLGPLEVQADDGAAVYVAGARLRTLLIALALEPGRLVSTAALVDGIWGEDPPAGAVNAVQALVSRLRRALPDARIESHPTGYRLVIDSESVDAARFERLVTAGRSALAEDAAAAARILGEALGLWRGPALLDVAEADFFEAPVARLAELRLVAVEDRVEADFRLGRGGELTTELTTLVAEHPLRERLVGALMRSLAAAGRPAEALTVYERAREALAETLGADPSPELSALHTALLRGELSATPGPGDADERPRTNLRAGLTSFIGRDEDVARVGKLVGEHRLATLTGPGGSGKTRLSIEAARAQLDQMPDGVWMVELASIGDGADIPAAVLAALGLREQALMGWASAGEPIDRLAAALRTHRTLLVLDNCEHLIDAVAALTDRLLGECPRLRILATSREPLGITGEALWPVEPLALPPEDADAASAMSYAAVRLLVDRAGAIRPGFAVTERTAPAVARVCRALDGMPLAIELAAARLRTMTVEQLAAGLDDRFRLLTRGSRVVLPRHQTLRGVVDWSWELLADEERVLLRRLAVFSGGATAAAAERVCADGAVPADRVIDLLAALTDKSLLVVGGDDGMRYRMLETIKAYGLERLDQAGELDRIRRAHGAYFLDLVETADPHLRRAEQLVWLARLSADHENIIAALRGAITAGDAQTAVRLAAAAGWFWWLGRHRTEGFELTAAALAVPGEVDDETRVTAYAVSALHAMTGLGDERQADGWLREIRRATERPGYRHPLVRFINVMGTTDEATAPPVDAPDFLAGDDPWVRAVFQLNQAKNLVFAGGEHTEAEAHIEAALAGFRELGERWGISFSLMELADLVARRGDLAAAHSHYEEAIAGGRTLGAIEDVPFVRVKQAHLQWLLGDPAGSKAAIAEAERDAEKFDSPDALALLAYGKAELALWSGDLITARTQLDRFEAISQHTPVSLAIRAMVLDVRGYLDALEGDLDAARAHRADALTEALNSMDRPMIGRALVGVADLALRQGQPDEAARLLAASDAVRGMPDLTLPDAARVEAAARAALGEQEFAEAARRGQDATLATVREMAAATLDA